MTLVSCPEDLTEDLDVVTERRMGVEGLLLEPSAGTPWSWMVKFVHFAMVFEISLIYTIIISSATVEKQIPDVFTK